MSPPARRTLAPCNSVAVCCTLGLATVSKAVGKKLPGSWTTTGAALAAMLSPAGFVTTSVNVVVAVTGPLLAATPEETSPTKWSTTPVPPVKTAVSVVAEPARIGVCAAVWKLAMTGAGTTATVVFAVTASPAALVTLSVNVTSVVRMAVLAGTSLATAPIPWSIAPAPPVKTAVRRVARPVVTADLSGTKLAILGGATTFTLAVPACETVPAAFMAVQERETTPTAGAEYVTPVPLAEVAPLAKTPPEIVHRKVFPFCAGMVAAMPDAPAVTFDLVEMTGARGAATTVTLAFAVVAPDAFAAVRVSVVEVSGDTWTLVPLTAPTPSDTVTVSAPVTDHRSVVACPEVIVPGVAEKLEMAGERGGFGPVLPPQPRRPETSATTAAPRPSIAGQTWFECDFKIAPA